MTYLAKPKLHPRELPRNKLGYTHRDYEGTVSTLCAGCGHDSISAAIIQAFYELDIAPHRVVKLSGIGCSSKTPTYFLGNSHGFNSVHGRMPSVLTGANLAEHNEAVNRLDFMPMHSEIATDYALGSVQEVMQHDGSVLRLRKLHDGNDASDRIGAMNYLQQRHAEGEIVTGLLYSTPSP